MAYKPIKVPEDPWKKVQDTTEYLYCEKHKEVFVKGWRCRLCKPVARTIYDDWQPSMDEGLSPPSLLGEVPPYKDEPQPGIYKLEICPLHNVQYVQGLWECPECKAWGC